MNKYQADGLSYELSSARVCQDIILKAISDGPLNKNITIKGGVVMQSITQNIRRATRDIDLDFIHYPLTDDAIKTFIKQLDCSTDFKIEIDGEIEELNHQDYHGKRVKIVIKDKAGSSIKSKMDIGVHKHYDIEQETFCFDVCMDDDGASLLKNSIEQSIVEKLRSLIFWGTSSTRYKDVFDIYYGIDISNKAKILSIIDKIIIEDEKIRESSYNEIAKKLKLILEDKNYLERVSTSKQRWIDDDIETIAQKLISYFSEPLTERLE